MNKRLFLSSFVFEGVPRSGYMNLARRFNAGSLDSITLRRVATVEFGRRYATWRFSLTIPGVETPG
ncbi:MAG TPA: hypothetical protein VJM12_08630 [Pyrinomonadaceae bacterium]|nr:hypothetical protein [Pyrinomonadaceae bacterium]